MKRMLCLLLLISLLCSVVAVFTACNSDGGEVDNSCCKNPVERKRLEERIEPTCVDAGSYTLVTFCETCEAEIKRESVVVPATGRHITGEKKRENEEVVNCILAYDDVARCICCDIEMVRTHITEEAKHTAGDPQRVEGEAPTCESFGYYYINAYCTGCGKLLDSLMYSIDPIGHKYEGGSCIHCGAVKVDVHYADVYWDQTDNFIFSLTENSNNQELPSTCARYLAGNLERGLPPGERLDYIDDLVAIRNDGAITVTKVEPLYTYIPEDKVHGWGGNIKDMVDDMSTYVEGITPDVYCNFVYDMVNASLSGAFANLKSSTIKTDGSTQKNWFRFTDPTFVDTGDGYMVEYMRSLSLSRNKQYCLSSDYFTDMVRAFFVVPVNIQLLETLPLSNVEGAFNYDYIADGKYTIEDFYEFVYTGKWSYATLAEISDVYNFYVDDGAQATDDPNGDLNDRLIFAIGESSGLSASGMLYTTSVTVIERKLTTITDGAGNQYTDYEYFYPSSDEDPNKDTVGYVPSNQSLYEFCDALTSLMSEHKGIISISNTQECGYYPGDALLAIRDRFVNNRILFGGDICLGSLEYTEYTSMTDGFGIVPVPLFRTEREVNKVMVAEKYMTQIHNIGRIGGINAKTTNFAKISAYLDYMSMYSTDILEEYYETKLCGDVAGGGAHKEMLIYIRTNVRTSFDKAFEDAIGYLFIKDSSNAADATLTSEQQKWHALIMSGKFEFDSGDMAQAYNTYVKTKADRLNALEASYVGLPS